MKLGFGLPGAGAWATPDRLVTVARRAAEPRNDYPLMPSPSATAASAATSLKRALARREAVTLSAAYEALYESTSWSWATGSPGGGRSG